MEELTKRNDSDLLLRKIEKALGRFDISLKFPLGRIEMGDEEIETKRPN